jgi:long-chain acyl-CoA synthetase
MARAAPVWEQAYPKDVRWAFKPSEWTVPDLLKDTVKRHPHRVCVDFMGATQTYSEIWAQVRHFAAGLQQMGVTPGMRVGICLPNSPAFVIAYYGAMLAGAVVVNFNPLYTADEIAHQVKDSGTQVMVTVNIARIFPKVEQVFNDTELQHVIVADFAAMLPKGKAILMRTFKGREMVKVRLGGPFKAFEDILACREAVKDAGIVPGDVALLQYTGGTTGVPKGAMLTHKNLVANTEQVKLWLGPVRADGEVFLVVLPLFHVFAMTSSLNLPVSVGATMVLLPLFSLKLLFGTIKRVKPTLFAGVPSLFTAVVNHGAASGVDLKSIRWCISGGAPLMKEMHARFETMTGSVLVEGYGLTEAAPVVCCNPREGINRVGTVGLPLPGTDVEIRALGNPGKVLKAGERGEVCVRGPQVMRGYWLREDETRKVMTGGWLRTGDVGYMDIDGFVHLTDRMKDIIISHGYNVYPRVIEEAISKHPKVAEVTAIAIPHAHKGEAAKVFVSLKPGAKTSEAEIMAFARQHLSPIECPVEVEIRKSLPKTLMGKLSKKELVAEEKLKRETHR